MIPKGGRVSFLLSLLGRDQKTTQEDEIKLLIDFGVIAQWQKRERVHIKQKACDDGSIPSHPFGELLEYVLLARQEFTLVDCYINLSSYY